MSKIITGAWRAFSELTQVAIGTAQAVTMAFNWEGTDLTEPEPGTFFVNTNEMTGQTVPTTHRLLTMKMAAKHKSKAFPSLVALLASSAMGKDTSTVVGATTAYSHLLQLDKTVVDLPTRTMVENDGDQQFAFVGVACSGFTLSGQRGGFVEFEADLMGTGEEGADATAEPGKSAESYLAYGDVNLKLGGAYDGTAATGGTDVSGQLHNFKIGVKNNAKDVYLMGDNTGRVGAIRRGLTHTIDLEADIEILDRSARAALLAGTEMVLHIPIVGAVANGTAHYGIDIVAPRVVYKAAKKGATDGILKIGGKFEVLADPTYGALDIRVTNLHQPSYLATA